MGRVSRLTGWGEGTGLDSRGGHENDGGEGGEGQFKWGRVSRLTGWGDYTADERNFFRI